MTSRHSSLSGMSNTTRVSAAAAGPAGQHDADQGSSTQSGGENRSDRSDAVGRDVHATLQRGGILRGRPTAVRQKNWDRHLATAATVKFPALLLGASPIFRRRIVSIRRAALCGFAGENRANRIQSAVPARHAWGWSEDRPTGLRASTLSGRQAKDGSRADRAERNRAAGRPSETSACGCRPKVRRGRCEHHDIDPTSRCRPPCRSARGRRPPGETCCRPPHRRRHSRGRPRTNRRRAARSTNLPRRRHCPSSRGFRTSLPVEPLGPSTRAAAAARVSDPSAPGRTTVGRATTGGLPASGCAGPAAAT